MFLTALLENRTYEYRIKKRTRFLDSCVIRQRVGLWSHAGDSTSIAFQQTTDLIRFVDLDTEEKKLQHDN